MEVSVDPKKAFELYTGGINRWWQRGVQELLGWYTASARPTTLPEPAVRPST